MEIKDIMAVYKILIFIFIVTLTFNGCFDSGTNDDEEIPTDTTEIVSGLLEPKNGTCFLKNVFSARYRNFN